MATLAFKHISTPWLGASVEYRKPSSRDVYGKPSGYDSAILPANVRVSTVEMLDRNNTRVKRQGLVVEVWPQDFFAIDDHLYFGGVEYDIVGINQRTDYRGDITNTVLTAVTKRGNS